MDKNPRDTRRMPTWVTVIIILFLLTFIMNLFSVRRSSTAELQISYDQFLDLVEAGMVEQVYMNDDQIQITLLEGTEESDVAQLLGGEELPEGVQEQNFTPLRSVVFYTGRVDDPSLVTTLRENDVRIYEEVSQQTSAFSAIASWLVPIAIMYILSTSCSCGC